MPPRIRFLYSTMMLTLFLVAAVPLYRELSRRPDIWWTPRAMLVPLDQSTERVEIYVRGRPLAELLQRSAIRIAEGSSVRVLNADEVGLRLNNWDRVRAEGLPVLVTSTAGCVIAAIMFLLIVTGRLAYRGERTERAN